MSKVLVNIASAQTIPSFLFIKDFYQEGDKLLFFTTKKVHKSKDYIIEALRLTENISDEQVIDIELKEECWPTMVRQIKDALKVYTNVVVNTTGGTKYMSMAVQSVCIEMQNGELYYVPYPKNVYLKLDGTELPIRYRISVREYVVASKSIRYTEKHCTQSSEYSNFFFNQYLKITEQQREIIDKIRRNFRNQKCEIDSLQQVNDEETCIVTNEGKKSEKRYDFERIDGIVKFFSDIKFPREGDGLTKNEIDYITGGWFEEYLFYIVQNTICADDVRLGVVINQTENTNPNDLDVVFTKGNKLFVIECKTGISATEEKSETGMFKEISYKAASIRASLLGGLSEKSMICSLSEGKSSFKKTAKNMGIDYYDRSFFVEEEKQKEFIGDILNHAN